MEEAVGSVRRVTKNFLFVTVAEVFDIVVGLVLLALIARYLPKDRFGIYAFILALTAVFRVVTDFGVTQITIREIARNKESAGDYLGGALCAQALLSVLTLALIAGGAVAYGMRGEDLLSIYVCGFAVVFLFIGKLFAGITQAFERMEFDAMMTVIQQVVLLAGTIFAVELDMGLVGIFSAFALSNLAYICAGVSVVFVKFVRPRFAEALGLAKYLVREGFPVGIKRVFGRVSLHCDILIMKGLKVVPEAMGIFRGGYRIVQSLMIFPIQLSAAAFPVFSRLSVKREEALRRAVRSTIKVVLVVGLALSAVLFIYAGEIINLILGARYGESVIVLKILSWMMIFEFVRVVLGRALIASGHQSCLTVAVMAGLGVNGLLDLILIPTMDEPYVGASIATLFGEATILTVCAYYLRRRVGVALPFSPALKALVALGGWLVLSLGVKGFIGPLDGVGDYALSALGVVVFAFFLWAGKFVENDEMLVIKALLRGFRGGRG